MPNERFWTISNRCIGIQIVNLKLPLCRMIGRNTSKVPEASLRVMRQLLQCIFTHSSYRPHRRFDPPLGWAVRFASCLTDLQLGKCGLSFGEERTEWESGRPVSESAKIWPVTATSSRHRRTHRGMRATFYPSGRIFDSYFNSHLASYLDAGSWAAMSAAVGISFDSGETLKHSISDS